MRVGKAGWTLHNVARQSNPFRWMVGASSFGVVSRSMHLMELQSMYSAWVVEYHGDWVTLGN